MPNQVALSSVFRLALKTLSNTSNYLYLFQYIFLQVQVVCKDDFHVPFACSPGNIVSEVQQFAEEIIFFDIFVFAIVSLFTKKSLQPNSKKKIYFNTLKNIAQTRRL